VCYLSGLRFVNKAVRNVRHFHIYPNQDPSRDCTLSFFRDINFFYLHIKLVILSNNETNKTQYYLSKVRIGMELTSGAEDVRQAMV
jgi:hypothetical protein